MIKPTDLRGILRYVPRFQGQSFVLALDGAIVADENFGNLAVDIAVLRSLGIKVVLVHGIGHQLAELSAQRKIPITNVDGTGLTDAATLDLALDQLVIVDVHIFVKRRLDLLHPERRQIAVVDAFLE
jgi:amino-acid N-acetyltransferase